MKTNLHHPLTKSSQRGLALIMTVMILALVTVMVLGFADMVRNESISSDAHVERAQSQAFAQMGVDMVVGTLRKHTADPAKVWATQPGALLVPAEGATGSALKKLDQQIPLHSGLAPAPATPAPGDPPDEATKIFEPAELNIQTLNDPDTHVISDQRVDPSNASSPVVSLRLKWFYMRKNGDLEYVKEPALDNVANPLIGRYAWWADDESSKVNINTAWKRNPVSGSAGITNPFGPSHVASVNLATLFMSGGVEATRAYEMADEIHTRVTPEPYDYTEVNRFYNSSREMRDLGPEFIPVFNNNKFELTHYNHDPDTTFFNKPRLVLTTQETYAPRDAAGKVAVDPDNNWPYYLDILKTKNSDPGEVSKIDPVKLDKTIKHLVSYLQKDDWPVAKAGNSIQSKYYGTAAVPEARLTQLALNIIDYVRSAESSRTLVEPIRGILDLNGEYGTKEEGAFVPDFVDGKIRGLDNTYKGVTRSFFISEMATYIADSPETGGPNEGRYKCVFFIELHLPKNFGVDQINLTDIDGKKIYVFFAATGAANDSGGTASGYYDPNDGTELHEKCYRVSAGNLVRTSGGMPSPMLKAGEYKTIRLEAYLEAAKRPTKISLRTALMLATDPSGQAIRKDPGTHRFELSPVGPSVSYNVDTGKEEKEVGTLEVEDPVANVVKQDYVARPSNTFNLENSLTTIAKGRKYTINPALGLPEQDTDKDGNVTDVGLQMPYPKGHEKNKEGVVRSPGELGFIHTGLEISSTAAKGGVPFRTLRLQPYKYYTKSDEVPDWAFMDLFTVPVTVPDRAKGVFAPHAGTAGRINLNAQAQPFGDPALVASPLERRQAIAALLTGAYTEEPSKAKPEGVRITPQKVAEVARNIYFRTRAANGKVYGYANAYDSPGEVVEIEGVADQGEESETLVRGIANLISTRGGVFTVSSVGQSLQQTRSGNLVVTGEARQQIMLERYTDPSLPDEVKFRRVRYEPVYP